VHGCGKKVGSDANEKTAIEKINGGFYS